MHLELTSRCTLACPACPRTWFSDTFKTPFPKQDLDLDDLKKFLDCDSGKQIDNFMLNGNHGDPIYYPRLFELINTFRYTKSFKISTNGSYQSKKFWHELGDRLTNKDTVYFSIDGLEENNHMYRQNSNWQSIMDAVDIMVTKSAKVVWKTLIFSYNQNHLEQIKLLAESKGCKFVCESTSRYGADHLVPANNLIDTSRLYNTELKNFSGTLEPQCLTQEYISADGFFWPCCLITSYYTLHKTELWKNRQLWSIKNQTLDQAREKLKIWYDQIIEDPKNAHDVCKMSCKPGQKFGWPSV
jgi:MoaA/NifB/PqqE/SkfB family radical SAM enzyme